MKVNEYVMKVLNENTEYNSGNNIVKINKEGIVISSTLNTIKIGDKLTKDFIKNSGWKKVKQNKTYFSTGESSGRRFLK